MGCGIAACLFSYCSIISATSASSLGFGGRGCGCTVWCFGGELIVAFDGSAQWMPVEMKYQAMMTTTQIYNESKDGRFNDMLLYRNHVRIYRKEDEEMVQGRERESEQRKTSYEQPAYHVSSHVEVMHILYHSIFLYERDDTGLTTKTF